jgi:hypothetical protein
MFGFLAEEAVGDCPLTTHVTARAKATAMSFVFMMLILPVVSFYWLRNRRLAAWFSCTRASFRRSGMRNGRDAAYRQAVTFHTPTESDAAATSDPEHRATSIELTRRNDAKEVKKPKEQPVIRPGNCAYLKRPPRRVSTQ